MKLSGTRAYIEPTPVPKMPVGLVELMEGLSREVLKNNPTDVYKFCAQHMKNLIVLRDGKPSENYLSLEQKIKKANNIIKRRAEERRRNFDINIRKMEQENYQRFGKDMEIASIVIKANNLNMSTEDSDLREENVEILDKNIQEKDTNLDSDISNKDDVHQVRDENVIVNDNCNNESKTEFQPIDNGFVNQAVSESSTDVKEYVHNQNEGNNVKINAEQAINGDKSDDPIYTKSEENENCSELVQEIDNKVENEVKSDLVSTNIKINEFSNAEGSKLIADDICVKENKDNEPNENLQTTSKVEGEQNNILNAHETNEQNHTGDNFKEAIAINTSDFLEDRNLNNETKNFDSRDNLQVTNINVNDTSKDTEKNDGINHVTKSNVLDAMPAKEVDINILKNSVDEEILTGTEKTINQLDITKTDEKDSEINYFIEVEQNDTNTIVEIENTVSESENQKQDIESTNKLSCENDKIDKASDVASGDKNKLAGEQSLDKISDCNDTPKEGSDRNNSTNNPNENDLTIKNESDNHKNSEFDTKETDDIESKNNNEAETNKLKNPKTMDLETAAITIQKVFRNFLFRSKTSSLEEPTNIEFNLFGREPDAKDEAHFTIQNQIKDRRVMGISRMDTVLQTVNEEKSLSLSTDDSSTISSAATVIQAHIRGFLCRNRLNRNKHTTSSSFNTSKDSSPVTSEADPDLAKTKTVLNIHIVPEGGQFLSRDESTLTSTELSLDGSPPTSANLHPLGYDKSERRKQLKREDAIQSISPPSNNSKLSEEQDSVKEVVVNEVEIGNADKINDKMPCDSKRDRDTHEQIKDVFISDDKIDAVTNIAVREPSDSQTASNYETLVLKDDVIEKHSSNNILNDVINQSEKNEFIENVSIEVNKTEIEKNTDINILAHSQNNYTCDDITSKDKNKNANDKNVEESKAVHEMPDEKEEPHKCLESAQNINSQNIPTHDDVLQDDEKKKDAREISSDELDVVTPFTLTEENDSDNQKLLHSGEFHDVVLPTKVSRSDTSVVSGE